MFMYMISATLCVCDSILCLSPLLAQTLSLGTMTPTMVNRRNWRWGNQRDHDELRDRKPVEREDRPGVKQKPPFSRFRATVTSGAPLDEGTMRTNDSTMRPNDLGRRVCANTRLRLAFEAYAACYGWADDHKQARSVRPLRKVVERFLENRSWILNSEWIQSIRLQKPRRAHLWGKNVYAPEYFHFQFMSR